MTTTTTTPTTTTAPYENKFKPKLLDAILWDMDGVLAETERDAHRVAFNIVFKERNLNTEWTIDGYGKLLHVGGGKERMTSYWNTVGWPESICDTIESTRQDKVKELHLIKTEIFNNIIKEGNVPLRPGVERLIDDAINAGLQLAVCSTSNEIAVRNLVTTLLGDERASKFTAIFAGDIVTNKKPSPDIYNLAVNELDLDKSRCLIVEDSGIGYAAASSAGICCIVTKSVYTEHENFDGADLIITDLDHRSSSTGGTDGTDGTDGGSSTDSKLSSEKVTLHTIEELLQKRIDNAKTTTIKS
jgi:HAD superfamily hydrolase (TIGR01509 family)